MPQNLRLTGAAFALRFTFGETIRQKTKIGIVLAAVFVVVLDIQAGDAD
jgi:hypothetical protein